MEKLLHPDMAGARPPCFKREWMWRDWIKMEIAEYTVPNRNGYCQHCTPAYKKQMEQERLCLHREVTFALGEDGFTGVRIPGPNPIKWLRLEGEEP